MKDLIGLESPEGFTSASGYATHEVLNQPSDLADYNAYAEDRVLVETVTVFGAEWANDTLWRAGAYVGNLAGAQGASDLDPSP